MISDANPDALCKNDVGVHVAQEGGLSRSSADLSQEQDALVSLCIEGGRGMGFIGKAQVGPAHALFLLHCKALLPAAMRRMLST